jgi:hypothetical protein
VNTWEATYKTMTGGLVRVRVQCFSSLQARQLLEAQYGRGNIINIHQVN